MTAVSNLDAVHKELRDELMDAWQQMLSTEGGRLILWSILDKSCHDAVDFYDNGHDALLRGRQQVGAEILNDFVTPLGIKSYADMLVEAEKRDKRLQIAVEADEKNQTEDE